MAKRIIKIEIEIPEVPVRVSQRGAKAKKKVVKKKSVKKSAKKKPRK